MKIQNLKQNPLGRLMSELPPLPVEADRLCQMLGAPLRLQAHLGLVHGTAVELIACVHKHFSQIALDDDAVFFGAATHDLGKVLHPEELSEHGMRHESDGPALLEQNGVPMERARFARTHARWNEEPSAPLEDLLVALADKIWKGKRDAELEALIVTRVAAELQCSEWECFAVLDAELERIAERGDERLAWMRQFPSECVKEKRTE